MGYGPRLVWVGFNSYCWGGEEPVAGLPGESGPAWCHSSGLTLAGMARVSARPSPKFSGQCANVPRLGGVNEGEGAPGPMEV